jgi:cold shock CspA family protein
VVIEVPPCRNGWLLFAVKAQQRKGGLQHMPEGELKWFSATSSYGLISPDNGGRALFVRSMPIASESGALKKGDRVTYEVAQRGTGTQARNVSKAAGVRAKEDAALLRAGYKVTGNSLLWEKNGVLYGREAAEQGAWRQKPCKEESGSV